MSEPDAEVTAEMPEHARKVGGGSIENTDVARQADAACDENTKGQILVTMERVLCRENMLRAYQRVVSNAGAPGVDGMTVEQLKPLLQARWETVRKELLDGTYQPTPVRKAEIPKPGGGLRTLGIPTVLDRLIQQALYQALQGWYDPTFSDHSFGFRLGRGTHDAIERAREHVVAGHRLWVGMDLEKFFDRVNHDILMSRLARRIGDKRILRLIRRYLQAGMMEGGLVSPRAEGTPQGGPLSPLLSNILLDELDKELERRGHKFCRYADDCNVYVRSRSAGERVKESITKFLEKRLRLKVNEEKSAIGRPWERKFLGYSMTWHREPRLKVADNSVKRLKEKLREILRQGRGRNIGQQIEEELTPLLRGWMNYFRLAEVKGIFEELDSWIRRKLRCVIWRQWKRIFARAKGMMKRGLDKDRAVRSAKNGRGPWWNAGASHMNAAFPKSYFDRCGLLSLQDQRRRLQSTL